MLISINHTVLPPHLAPSLSQATNRQARQYDASVAANRRRAEKWRKGVRMPCARYEYRTIVKLVRGRLWDHGQPPPAALLLGSTEPGALDVRSPVARDFAQRFGHVGQTDITMPAETGLVLGRDKVEGSRYVPCLLDLEVRKDSSPGLEEWQKLRFFPGGFYRKTMKPVFLYTSRSRGPCICVIPSRPAIDEPKQSGSLRTTRPRFAGRTAGACRCKQTIGDIFYVENVRDAAATAHHHTDST